MGVKGVNYILLKFMRILYYYCIFAMFLVLSLIVYIPISFRFIFLLGKHSNMCLSFLIFGCYIQFPLYFNIWKCNCFLNGGGLLSTSSSSSRDVCFRGVVFVVDGI